MGQYTTPLEMPRAAAMYWCECLPSNLRRSASLSLRMLILAAGMAFLLSKSSNASAPSVEIHVQHHAAGVDRRTGHDHRNGRSRSRNGRSRSTGITGHVAPEYPVVQELKPNQPTSSRCTLKSVNSPWRMIF